MWGIIGKEVGISDLKADGLVVYGKICMIKFDPHQTRDILHGLGFKAAERKSLTSRL